MDPQLRWAKVQASRLELSHGCGDKAEGTAIGFWGVPRPMSIHKLTVEFAFKGDAGSCGFGTNVDSHWQRYRQAGPSGPVAVFSQQANAARIADPNRVHGSVTVLAVPVCGPNFATLFLLLVGIPVLVIAIVNAGPAILLEGHLPSVPAFIEPAVDALTHVYTIVFAARKQ